MSSKKNRDLKSERKRGFFVGMEVPAHAVTNNNFTHNLPDVHFMDQPSVPKGSVGVVHKIEIDDEYSSHHKCLFEDEFNQEPYWVSSELLNLNK